MASRGYCCSSLCQGSIDTFKPCLSNLKFVQIKPSSNKTNHTVLLPSILQEKLWNSVSINSCTHHHVQSLALANLPRTSSDSWLLDRLFVLTHHHIGLVVHRSTKPRNLVLIWHHTCSHAPSWIFHTFHEPISNVRTEKLCWRHPIHISCLASMPWKP